MPDRRICRREKFNRVKAKTSVVRRTTSDLADTSVAAMVRVGRVTCLHGSEGRGRPCKFGVAAWE